MILRGKARFGPAVIFVLVVIAIGGGLMVSLASGQRAIRDEAALEIARSYASTLRQLQQFYASEVLSHIDPTQVAVTQDYQSAPHAVPMPATLTIDFAEYITRDTPDLRAAMRSDQPFYWRDTMLTPFETRALATLRETGGAEVAEFGTNPDGQRTLHYATPITMTGVCVDCHNTHPDSPHTDWAIGDIRGIHVIEAPVGVLGADIPSRSGLLLVAVMSTALMAGLLLALSRAREMAALTDLAARNTELERANAAKDAANRAKSAFIANISHEIRTPLNGLLGLADVLAQDSDTPETRGRVSQMQTAGHSLLRVVNDVLDFSQIEARQMNISTAAFQPEALVEQVVDLFLSDVGGGAGTSSFGPHTDLIVTVAPDVPDWLMGDAFRIKQVLTNLVGNALKFTNSGHVELHMRRDPGNPARLLYEVEDTGIGITESQIARLFQPFSQADGSDTRRHGGTGLGLAISRSLAEQMGGILRVRSIPGVGSTFTLDLPLILAGAYTPVPLPTPPDTLHHVVLWSASAKVGSGVAYALERAGLSVTKAATPQEARAQILAAPDAQHSLLIAAPNGPAPAALANLCGPEAQARVLFLVPQGQITDPLCPHAAHRPLMPAALMARLTRVMQTPLAAPRHAAADAHTDGPPEAAPVVASDTSLDIPQAPPSEHLTEVAAKAPRDDTGDAAPAPPPPTLAPEESLESLRVLVVDDNELNRIVTKSFLDRSRATVALAESGAQALELAAQNTFDVVLMDIQMPDMDGYETTQRLRALGYDMPVLAVTSNAMQHDIDRSAAEGLQAHLTKPLSRGKLVAELRPYVGATKSPARVAKTRAAHTPHATSATIPPIPAGMPQPPAGLPQTLRSLGVNLDRGLRLHGDAWPAYTAALTEFAHTTAHLPDTLQDALRQGDLAAAATTCQTMMSHLFLIGADPLAKQLRAMAQVLRFGNTPAKLQIDRLCQRYDLITETVQSPKRKAAL